MRWGIKHQVLLLALVPTIVISLLLGTYFTSTRLHDLEQTFRERGETIALKLAPMGELGVFSQNKALLQNLAESAFHEHEVQNVGFYTETGKEIASYGNPSFSFQIPHLNPTLSTQVFIEENENAVAFIVPIIANKKVSKTVLGWLKLELETKSMRLRADQVLIHTGLIFLLGLSLSGLHAFQMGRNVTRPILELAQAVEHIKEGDLNTRIRLSGYRELRILESGINTMAQALEDAHTQLQNRIERATANLCRSLETIEVQNFELAMARNVAENASQVKSEFLADMSHEIRTPLNAIIGFIHLLHKTELDEKQKEFLATLQKSSTHLLSIINDILDFSKIEAGKLRLERTPVRVQDCVEETLSLLAPHAHEKGIALIPLIYSDVPNQILTDALRLKQVITNLVNNAIKFTDKGSVVVKVMLERETPSEVFIRVCVTDTGIGLSPDEQQQLFQAFSQIKLGTTRQSGGTGLGLAICKKLVEQLGGTIGLESERHKGSTFWFTFAADKCLEKETTPELIYLADEKEIPLSQKILAVDDNPDNLKLITLFLEDFGAKVVAVNNGLSAIEMVKTHDFDLIFMDIRMPNLNGIETTKIIRQFEATHKQKPTPIIALTAHAFISERDSLLQAGIDDYLIKPIDLAILRSILEKWAQKDSPPSTEKAINWTLGYRLAGGKKDLAIELLNNLIQTLPEEKVKINQAFVNKDIEELEHLVHRLHGACCYCGVPGLKNKTKKLENAAATHNWESIKLHLDEFNLAIDEVLTESVLV